MMVMNKFNVGDKVRVINPPGWLNDIDGDIGVVVSVHDGFIAVDLNFHKFIAFGYDELELIIDTPAFAVGDRVEWVKRGTVNRIGEKYTTVVDGIGAEIIIANKYLTKITPQFPTKPGSVIKAKYLYRDGPETFLRRERNDKDGERYVWLSPFDGESYDQKFLELISIEYVPGDDND
jgi:hypothetical protein